ncbi:C4-dicarboxylate ABC transporter [Bacillus sp. M6-12]|uniref:TRAP transporter substrate-binding protein n=1 Tax=Bacillus sp. M6-12 TaxID=2054166 RepID=UPI000C77802B|nr:TRAP transporter substrate-binding protein [Bacillus sp. M6-12]PLS17345.1 C4-dicarboxylate ABC transporter [Bacillus sp. M6-12]
MKKWLSSSAAIIMAGALLVGCSSEKSSSGGEAKAKSGEATVLKLGHVWPESEIHAKAAEEFAKEVEEKSAGKLKIEIFGDGTLGDDKDLLEGLKVGTADIWAGGAGVLSSASETANIFTVPFMFENQDHFNKVFDGEVGKDISDKILEESQYKVLSYWTRGARWLTVNKEVKTPEDLKGLKVRVPDSPMFVKSFEQLGASPTPMAFGEVFTSMQQGVIDGQENPLSLIYNSKFNEVVDYLVKTEHVREPIAVVISGSKFDSLSPELQKVLEDAANGEGKTFAADEVEKGDSTYLKGLEEAGMKVVEPDLGAFQKKLDGFIEKEFPGITEFYEKVRAAK